MKTKTFLGLFIMLIYISVTSCQKQIVDPNPTAPVSGDSTLLSMYVILDTTLASPQDSVSKTVYTYDNQKRTTGNTLYEYSNGLAFISVKHSYFYNGNDTLINNETFVDYTATPHDSVKIYYFYNANQDIKKDSEVNVGDPSSHTYVEYYDYPNNRIYKTHITYSSATNINIDFNTHVDVVKVNNNIISEVDSFFSPGFTSLGKNVYSYDTHPNPFYHLFVHFSDNQYNYINDEPLPQNNNLIFETLNYNGFTKNTSYQYRYKPNGFPSEVKIDPMTIGLPIQKGYFYYTTR